VAFFGTIGVVEHRYRSLAGVNPASFLRFGKGLWGSRRVYSPVYIKVHRRKGL
jgi:hypothetical protein